MIRRRTSVDRPPHLLDRLAEGSTLRRRVVEMGDDVTCQDAGPDGGHALNCRLHLDEALLDGDVDAEATELAGHLHVA
jgi:hypothetical protein